MTEEQGIKAVTKLIELTQTGRLKWERSSNTIGVATTEDYKVEVVFLTEYDGHKLRLYRARERVVPSSINPLMPPQWSTWSTYQATVYPFASQPKDPYWTVDTVLEIIDDERLSMLKFPPVSGIRDLYREVAEKTSRVEDLLDRLLKTPGEAPDKLTDREQKG
jgi:hypothetical protein